MYKEHFSRQAYRTVVLALAAAILLAGCSLPTGTRKITAWGFWGVIAGVPVGIGYWSSEHGTDTEHYNPAKPPVIK